MQVKTFVAVRTPSDFYFIETPVESNSNLPSSFDYKFFELTKFIRNLFEKFPGTYRDLGAAASVQPEYLFRFAQPQTQAPNFCFPRVIDHETMTKLIKLYYMYVLSAELFD